MRGYYHDYGWKDTVLIHQPEEPEGLGAFDEIPVVSDSKGCCAACDKEEAKVLVRYERLSGGLLKRFREELCIRCYATPDYQIFLSKHKHSINQIKP